MIRHPFRFVWRRRSLAAAALQQSTLSTRQSSLQAVFFGGGLTIPLEGGLDDVDESLLALASSSSNSATRRVSRSISLEVPRSVHLNCP